MFLISIPALQRNTAILREVANEANCNLVLALKAFSCWSTFPNIRNDLDGCCASGLWEAKLAQEKFGKHIITYSPAYSNADIEQLVELTHHLDFNSLSQWYRFREKIMAHPRFLSGDLQCGLRINPEHSTGATPMYDPCAPCSRLGITAAELKDADLTGISGLHFHTLCEQGADALESTMNAVDEKFGHFLSLSQFTYLNMGGGHWITKPDYDRKRLVEIVRKTQEKYQLAVWLEPGEAVAIHSGVLRAEVMDVFSSGGTNHAILDISATAHMPDVIEMPYRPDIFLIGGEKTSEQQPAVSLTGETYELASDQSEDSNSTYHIGGPTCLAGDIVGDFSFSRPLTAGDILVFDDMAHYTMVKTTTFNGVKHPAIILIDSSNNTEIIREFGYEDFRDRLS